MSTDYIATQSNYFAVKDAQKFHDWIYSDTDEVHLVDGPKSTVAMFADGGWPAPLLDEDEDGRAIGDHRVSPEFIAGLAQHLQEASTAILMEVGVVSRGSRTIVDHVRATAVYPDGRVIELSVEEAIAKAAIEKRLHYSGKKSLTEIRAHNKRIAAEQSAEWHRQAEQRRAEQKRSAKRSKKTAAAKRKGVA